MAIAQDPEQPATNITAGEELLAGPPGAFERGLDQVFGVVLVAAQPPRRPLQGRSMSSELFGEVVLGDIHPPSPRRPPSGPLALM